MALLSNMFSFLIKAPDILCFTITALQFQAHSTPPPPSVSLSCFVDDLSYFGGLAEIAQIQFISLIKCLIMETTIVHK